MLAIVTGTREVKRERNSQSQVPATIGNRSQMEPNLALNKLWALFEDAKPVITIPDQARRAATSLRIKSEVSPHSPTTRACLFTNDHANEPIIAPAKMVLHGHKKSRNGCTRCKQRRVKVRCSPTRGLCPKTRLDLENWKRWHCLVRNFPGQKELTSNG
jgi:hypothetical protein